ncbi:hypothetical protein VTI74DRAFT_10242 [Chaetomium olivicolor]
MNSAGIVCGPRNKALRRKRATQASTAGDCQQPHRTDCGEGNGRGEGPGAKVHLLRSSQRSPRQPQLHPQFDATLAAVSCFAPSMQENGEWWEPHFTVFEAGPSRTTVSNSCAGLHSNSGLFRLVELPRETLTRRVGSVLCGGEQSTTRSGHEMSSLEPGIPYIDAARKKKKNKKRILTENASGNCGAGRHSGLGTSALTRQCARKQGQTAAMISDPRG